MTASPERNLTGVWTGLYTYADGRSVPFTATLLHSGAHLSGGVHEPNTMGGSEVLHATLSGRAEGGAVAFLKQYEGAPEGFTTAVDYQGALSPEGDEIEGRWSIPGWWAGAGGSFLMVRNRGAAVPAAKEQAADA
jgi:hypothetical protein